MLSAEEFEYKRVMRACEDKAADTASVRYWLRTTSEAEESLPGLGALCVEVLGEVLNHRWLDANVYGLELGQNREMLVSYWTLALLLQGPSFGQ